MGLPVDDAIERIYYIVNETRMDAPQFSSGMEDTSGELR